MVWHQEQLHKAKNSKPTLTVNLIFNKFKCSLMILSGKFIFIHKRKVNFYSCFSYYNFSSPELWKAQVSFSYHFFVRHLSARLSVYKLSTFTTFSRTTELISTNLAQSIIGWRRLKFVKQWTIFFKGRLLGIVENVFVFSNIFKN